MRQHNPHKSVQATGYGIIITYTNDKKSTVIPYDRQELEKKQLYGNTYKDNHYQRIAPPHFNSVQQLMYRKALYGLAVYDQQEISKMSRQEKFSIIKMQKKAQKVINIYKIDTINIQLKSFFGKYFHNSDQAKEFMDDKYTSYSEVCNIDFRDLGINKHMVAQKLIDSDVLPLDFFQLKTA